MQYHSQTNYYIFRKRGSYMAKRTLGEKLKEIRATFNYTQDYVASALGVSRQAYSSYENDTRNPSLQTLYEIATIYNTTVNDLLQDSFELDKDNIYELPPTTDDGNELTQFLDYTQKPANKQRLGTLNHYEKQLIYYFEKLSADDREEIIELAKIKARKRRKK